MPNIPPPISPRSSSFSHATSAWSDRTSFSSEPDTSITSVSGLDVENRSTDGHTEEDVSFSEEHDIYDAYVPDVGSSSSAPAPLPAGAWTPGKAQPPQTQHQPYSTQKQGQPLSPVVTPIVTIHDSDPVPTTSFPSSSTSAFEVRRGRRSPSPEPSSSSTHLSTSPKSSTAARRSPSPTPLNGVLKPTKDKEKEKDKKSGGLFSKWGSSDKAPKRSKTPTVDATFEPPPHKEKEKEKEVGFFGGLFSKKKADGGD